MSKLPNAGTTIFTVVSRRAAELGAVNLGQGFPDYPIDRRLADLVHEAMLGGHNQYAPMTGLADLRLGIAQDLQRRYGVSVNPENEVTITLGATEALFSSIQALVGAGDEVIVFDPSYDSYDPAVTLAGARCVHLPLEPPNFRFDWDRVRAAINSRTRLVIINSPQNPCCTCWTPADIASLAVLAEQHNLLVLSDEVYDRMVFDGVRHHSVLQSAALRERSVAVYSFGKVLHATGMRVGFAVAPEVLTGELRKVHQFNTFSISNPLQWAIARYMREPIFSAADAARNLAAFFQAKRDRFRERLAPLELTPVAAEGTYFQLLDYGRFSKDDPVVVADRLLTQAGVATIPLSVFYQSPPPMTLLRACIAKSDATVDEGAERLLNWFRRLS